MSSPVVPFDLPDDAALAARLAGEGLRITPAEARDVVRLLGRNPTRVEAVLFDTLWSEHCSYKSSRAVLKRHLPTEAPHVLIGPGEDAGVVYLTTHAGERWALVVGHESHNHPSQVVPQEGAATGIGGIVRDVYCMGGDVIGVLDALRFGSLTGPHGERSREIANGVVEGIWRYANALGVPNLGGDVVFDAGYDDNCLVNVVAVGVVPERLVVRSRVPEEARHTPYVLVLVGKPTDASGFGGAAFASAVLDDAEREANRSAVQVPDPFLKRVLVESTKQVLALLQEAGVPVGMKDLGAGGLACASSELAAAGGFGADVELSRVSVDGGPFLPEVIACSETQERYLWAVPETWAARVLAVYNDDFELPRLYPGARAQIVGRVRSEDARYRITHEGEEVCNVAVEAVTHGVRVERVQGAAPVPVPEPPSPEPEPDPGEVLAALFSGPALASREGITRFYDTEVQGRAVIRPGEADASVCVPVDGCPMGLAVGIGGNPFHGALDPYAGGAGAVVEAMRNVAAVGGVPWCLTDCLNYGSPEDPVVFRQFVEGVRGLGDAARDVGLLGETGVPVPVVSGNVSFYNTSAAGRAIPPSPIVACFGVLPDYAKAVTAHLKEEGHVLVLLGERRRELGGSAYWRHLGIPGGSPPRPAFALVRAEIEAVREALERGLVVACHDISEGGLAAAAVEMALLGSLGAVLDPGAVPGDLRLDEFLFSETGGFLMEVSEDDADQLAVLCANRGLALRRVGRVEKSRTFRIVIDGEARVSLDLQSLARAWRGALRETLQ